MAPETSIELLTADATEGARFPRDLGCVRYEPESPDSLAHRHTFYQRARAGQPIEGTLVEFYVPATMLQGGFPTDRALRLVQRRMGWT